MVQAILGLAALTGTPLAVVATRVPLAAFSFCSRERASSAGGEGGERVSWAEREGGRVGGWRLGGGGKGGGRGSLTLGKSHFVGSSECGVASEVCESLVEVW